MKKWIEWMKARHPALDEAALRYRICQQITLLSVFLNLLLAAIKLAAAYWTTSVSIGADGINNLSDALTNATALIFFYIANRNPDQKHPFGYQRMELIASLVMGIIILYVGFDLARESITAMLHPERIVFSWVAVFIMAFSIFVKAMMSFSYYRFARLLKSPLLKGYGMDARNDAFSTGVVLFSLLFGYHINIHFDGFVGLLLSILIMYSAFDLIRSVVSRLLGEAADPDLIKKTKEILNQDPNVANTHAVIIHSYGPSQNYATAHVEILDDQMSIATAHEIIDKLERKVGEELGLSLVIHIDPIDTNPKAKKIRKRFVQILNDIDETWALHDFRLEKEEEQDSVVFDLYIPINQRIKEDNVLNLIQSHLEPNEAYLIHLNIERID